ncbi:MAG TPA: hydantoinase/oxoprolinase family protein [Burkholderiaceae bacterium]|nr:hydantoinase/oxoprolinase family protein [Burkholderiaceae bacterium]
MRVGPLTQPTTTLTPPPGWRAPPAGRFYLGIDTGGTYTDAVLVDHAHRIVAAAKALTTRFDLAAGIGAALDQLDAAQLARTSLVSLSTTLTTNSVVEGKGAPVCALLAGYDAAQLKASGLTDLIGADAVVALAGGHDAMGREAQALDLDAARAAIVQQAPRVSAFAVSATFSVRNPAHEQRLRELVRALCDRPVTCGHELASSLGAPRRALTAALNARMVSTITRLIEAVQQVLAARRIAAPLMVVQGDATLVNAATALQRPVTTVLSGPAASVIGACALSGRRHAVVADMGGTTTDIAVVRDGQPALSAEGALVGHWRPMVEAVQVHAIGLGGDSEVRFAGGQGLAIGPRRVMPIALLGFEHPQVIATLERQQKEAPHAAQARFVQRWQADDAAIARLPEPELRAWEALAAGPVDMERINRTDRPLARHLARLERKGLAICSGFTPTDAAHVLGLSSHWSTEAATLGARLWARQMRHLYGHGPWPDGDAQGPSRHVVEHLVRSICTKLIEAGLNDAGQLGEGHAGRLAKTLTELALTRHAGDRRGRVFELRFAPDLPLVAVGAPAASYYPAVAERLGMALALPAFAGVANAVGAVLGRVAQRVRMTVTQVTRGQYRLFTPQGVQDFADLDAALAQARELTGAQARALALQAGARDIELTHAHSSNSVDHDIDGHVFFEAVVTATAAGAPRLGREVVAAA